ncbi:GNAT family N-acetyltransferase [Bacillus sp. AFS041924]|uniref:GNAT family N-acetyltransferase n=1 Tax=Bacillus sp. AFS041924 TaxID=2033503 RepID=UPI000BFB80CD|nr:GNAT family N-acetyltransferase [Bacillus sp. AFS041924]PGS50027.1 GNAT family N-acetyltransferase [Bacillus sp. AFS041924]
MGVEISLVKNNLKFVEQVFKLSSDPGVKDTLGIKVDKIEDTIGFINFIIQQELEGKVVNRIILNKQDEVVGMTTLKHIDRGDGVCHIGTWIGVPFWGEGYNEASKIEILKIAFNELKMDYVIAGAKQSNTRSRRAQEKLPYLTVGVEKEFPKELAIIEKEAGTKCVLNVVKREDFTNFIAGHII